MNNSKNLIKRISPFVGLMFLLVVVGCGKRINKRVQTGTVIEIGTVMNTGGDIITPGRYEAAIKVKLNDGSIVHGSTQYVVTVGKMVYRTCWEDKDGTTWCTQFTTYRP